MIATNYTNLRKNMKESFDKVTEDCETLVVTRKGNRNIVIISENSYNNLLENHYVRSTKENYDHILKGIAQYKEGKIELRNIDIHG